jgi:hypothetical protein
MLRYELCAKDVQLFTVSSQPQKALDCRAQINKYFNNQFSTAKD